MRALAEQAEAEAAEAEALAAAARARARAVQLRRQAEVLEAQKSEASAAAPVEKAPAKDAVDPADTEEAETEKADAKDREPTTGELGAAAETEAAPEAGTEAVPETATQRRRLRGRLKRPKWSTAAAALAILVILGALAGSGYMIKQHRDAVRQHQRVAEFTAAARQGVVTLTSLDFNNAKQGVQRILDNSTGSFRDDFLKMADDFTKVVEQSKVVSQGSVQAAAVDLDTMTDNSAVVLVASTSEVTNAAGAKQDPRNYRLIVTVARDGGQLKISKVEFVP
ncbi:hypothetical protein [Mycobacterium bohemicum]|uniref:Mce protein n=2 Tax=Mycobacterium bohemicum TaxID=56425 RepID=A0A1X1QYM0_MYCBE|nr:hypothetical protein [Mycobacterium bohemicum]MCV6969191.1 hypothetical protein [Mycobacterium bohemicum]ORU96554.1 hypothetical protein AWB93_19805 [Mycobacterium bohemicum]